MALISPSEVKKSLPSPSFGEGSSIHHFLGESKIRCLSGPAGVGVYLSVSITCSVLQLNAKESIVFVETEERHILLLITYYIATYTGYHGNPHVNMSTRWL